MFINSLKLFAPLESSIYDEYNNDPFIIEGDSDVDFINESGYVMKDNQYIFQSDIHFDISSTFTMGFYLYPYCHGVVQNPSDNSFENIMMPLFDFLNGHDSIIRFEEHAGEDCNNYLKIYLGDSFSIKTPSYLSSIWHYFWIVFDGSEVKVYVDGLEAECDEDGDVPSSIDGNTMSLYINHSIDGYDYNISKNLGHISNLFMLNEVNDNILDIQKSINRGILYVIDNDYINVKMDSLLFYMNDPNMITVTSSVDDVSYVYLGRNDGKILRGSPLFWESRKRFSNKEEGRFLILHGEDNISDGFLKIKESIIRL